MSKKTIALIVSLFIVTVVLLIAALQSEKKLPEQPTPTQTVQKPKPNNAYTELSLSPNPVYLVNNRGAAEVYINTNSNQVTAVQLEIKYDPAAISNVTVTTGDFFTQPVPLINLNDTKSGRVTYAFGISPAQEPVQGSGVLAQISFTKNPTATVASTTLELLQESLVTSSGIDESVLKTVGSTQVILSDN